MKRILYVEDHLNNVLLVQRIVSAEGHQLIIAADGQQGWEAAIAQQPDLILMDLHLPGAMDGLELTRRLKATPALRHIPVIALTAYGYAEVEMAAERAGCDGFLHKPADIRQIRAVFHQFLGNVAYPAAGRPLSTAPVL